MSLASVLQQVADEVGVTRPSVNAPVAADTSTQQFVALLKRAGEELIRGFDWSVLLTSGTISTVDGQEAYDMPDDFARFVDETQWNSSTRMPLFGPLNQPNWSQNEFGMVNVGPFFQQQLRGNVLYLQPTPSSVATINFYYVSKNWIYSGGGTTTASTFGLDADTFLFREDLLAQSLKWRWLRAKRLSYDEEKDEFDRLLIEARAEDRGARTLSMDPRREQWPQFGFIVPITGFGS